MSPVYHIHSWRSRASCSRYPRSYHLVGVWRSTVESASNRQADTGEMDVKKKKVRCQHRSPSRPYRLEADLYARVKRFLEAPAPPSASPCRTATTSQPRTSPFTSYPRASDRGRAQAGLHPRLRTARRRPARCYPPCLPGGTDRPRSPRLLGPEATLAHPPRRTSAVPAPRPRPVRRPSGSEGRCGTGGGDLRPLSAGLRLPRKNKARAALLLGEHASRRGDPNPGGAAGGKPLLTAYRQEALRRAGLHQLRMTDLDRVARDLVAAAVPDMAMAAAA